MAERSRRSGIRRRTTLAAVAVVGLVLVGAGLAMLTFVERSLVAQVEDAAEVRAGELAQALQGLDGSPPALPDVADPTEEFWQVLRDGVVAASANARGLEAIAEPSPGETVRLDGVPFASGPFVVLAESAGDVTVVVGRSVDDAAEARTAVTKALAVGIPVILAVVGVVTWWIVGRALRPVEEIRAEVGRISDAELHRRVPVPAGEDEIAQPRRHDERDARAARARPRPSAPLRLRRLARAALARGIDPPARGGRRRASGRRARRGAGARRARGGRSPRAGHR